MPGGLKFRPFRHSRARRRIPKRQMAAASTNSRSFPSVTALGSVHRAGLTMAAELEAMGAAMRTQGEQRILEAVRAMRRQGMQPEAIRAEIVAAAEAELTAMPDELRPFGGSIAKAVEAVNVVITEGLAE